MKNYEFMDYRGTGYSVEVINTPQLKMNEKKKSVIESLVADLKIIALLSGNKNLLLR